MRKGRGLVDQDIFDDMLSVPGTSKILLGSVCNHRFDKKTGKLRVEIAEEAWPEVKRMVAKWRKIRGQQARAT